MNDPGYSRRQEYRFRFLLVDSKKKVRSRYPHASAEQDGLPPFRTWAVWDISHDEQKRRYEKHWPQTFRRALLAIGDTEAEAWCRAVQDIEMREGH